MAFPVGTDAVDDVVDVVVIAALCKFVAGGTGAAVAPVSTVDVDAVDVGAGALAASPCVAAELVSKAFDETLVALLPGCVCALPEDA